MSAITTFSRINACLAVAGTKKSEVFIGDKFSTTRDKKAACSVEKVFNEIISFLIENRLHVHNGISEEQAKRFISNASSFAPNSQSPHIINRIECISDILFQRNLGTTRLNTILNKKNPPIADRKFLHLFLSLMQLENIVLKKAAFLFSLEKKVEHLTKQGLDQEVPITLNFEEYPPNRTVKIVLPSLIIDPSLKEGSFFPLPPLSQPIIEKLLQLKHTFPHETKLFERSLLCIELDDQFLVSNRSYEDLTTFIPSLQQAYFPMSADFIELFPLLNQFTQDLFSFFYESKEATESYIKSLEDRTVHDLEEDPEIALALLEIEAAITTKTLNAVLDTFENYGSVIEEKKRLYTQAFQKLRSLPKKKTPVLNNLLIDTPLLDPTEFLADPWTVPSPPLSFVEIVTQEFSPSPLVEEPVLLASPAQSSHICWVDIVRKKPEELQREVPVSKSNSVLPKEGLELTPDLRKIFLEHLEFSSWRTLVAAKDSASQGYTISRSLRMFSLNHLAKKETSLASTSSSYRFASLEMDRATAQQLHLAMQEYYREQPIDIPFLQGRFITFLFKLFRNCSTKKALQERFNALKTLYSENLLTNEQWDALEDLCRLNNLTEKSIAEVVRMRAYKNNALMMPIVQLTCGEIKIALDCIKTTSSLSPSEKSTLPRSLADRLTFVSIASTHNEKHSVLDREQTQIGTFRVNVLKICLSCRTIWPILEIMYKKQFS